MTLRFRRSVWSLLALSATVGAFAVPINSAVASEPRVVVASPIPIPANDKIVTTPMTPSFIVVLRQPKQAALTSFLSGLTNPTSRDYRHFLTPAQFAQRFGAPSSTIAAVRSYFEGFGLRIGTLGKGHTLLHVSGTTVDIAKAFSSKVATVSRSDGVLAAQFTTSATLPSSLAHDVTAVAGLSTVIPPHAMSIIHHSSAQVSGPSSCPAATGGSSATGTTPNSLGGYTLAQQGQLYGLDTAWANGDTGVGQSIALYELADYHSADVATYFQCYGVAPTITNTAVDGGPGQTNSGDANEATLDVEEAGGLAPGAKLEVYTGPNSGTGPVDVFAQIADQNTATIVTTSWGGCEPDPTNSPAAEYPIFEQMAAQGQSVIAAAGDAGSSDCADDPSVGTTTLAVDDPASQPYVTGVGGLTVSSINPLVQTVWNDGQGSGGGAGGGGVSTLWPHPAWQVAPGVPSTATWRMVPDLSVMGDPGTGFIEYFSGLGWDSVGGTSTGSPLVSALTAVAAQACSATPIKLGFLNPSLYAMATTGFIDVTTGSNDLYGVGSYSAGTGYDMASGLGSPNPATFMSGLCPAKFDATKSSFSLSSSHLVIGKAPATLKIVLNNSNGSPIANSAVNIKATTKSAFVLIDGDRTSETGNGNAAYSVNTDANGSVTVSFTSANPGAVAVTITYDAQTVYSTTLNFQSASTAKASRPSAPRIVSLTPLVGSFRFNVAGPASSGGRTVSAFQYSLNGGATWITFSAATKSVTVSHLAKGRTYQVIVRALNANGPGAPSAPSRVTTRT